jgi:biotin carboxylase
MSHLLVLDLPGGNDSDILQAAVKRGDSFVFATSDLALYRQQPTVSAYLDLAVELIEIQDFAYPALEQAVLASHQTKPIDALLCLIEIRLIEASKLARALGIAYLNLESATLLRDKFLVRQRLAKRGIDQPEFALATTTQEIKDAVDRLGLPVLIKPVDGYGSQNVVVLQTPEDLDPLLSPVEIMLPSRADYGLGVKANDRLLVERYMTGNFIGVDTLTIKGEHRFLGVNIKKMFPPPSFAIEGGCFSPRVNEHSALEQYVFSMLDAVGFDCGATHIELILTQDGPQLVEINPRLVGAKIGRLVGFAMNRSIHADLIDIHLGLWPKGLGDPQAPQVAVSRWFTSPVAGTIESITPPTWSDPDIKYVEILKKVGDAVIPAFENAARIGYVMACGKDQSQAEVLAMRYIDDMDIAVAIQ